MCIYLTDLKNLKYTSQEHIFPAGLGGKKKLPKGFVSDEFNNLISKVERAFMKESLASIPRQFMGPGKRGKLGLKHASNSKVHIMTDPLDPKSFSLGYMKLGKPYLIPHFLFDRVTYQFTLNFDHVEPEEPEQLRANFVEKLNRFDTGTLRIILKNTLPENIVLFGAHEKDKKLEFFLAKNTVSDFEVTPESVPNFIKHIENVPLLPSTQRFKPKSNQQMIIRPNEDFRIPAKMAFNALADILGYEKVLHANFDSIRHWIARGGESNPVQFLVDNPLKDTLTLPECAHLVLFHRIKDQLCAIVTLYNSFHFLVYLGQVDGSLSLAGALPGIICDWQNEREISVEEYLKITP